MNKSINDKYEIALLQAWEEFGTGKEITATCPKCGGKINILQPNPDFQVWITSCPCGYYNDTIRGL